MNIETKKKLEHDFANSLIVIHNLAKITSTILENLIDSAVINEKKINNAISSMRIIWEESSKLKLLFQGLLEDKYKIQK